jgi:hypothetical protein
MKTTSPTDTHRQPRTALIGTGARLPFNRARA